MNVEYAACMTSLAAASFMPLIVSDDVRLNVRSVFSNAAAYSRAHSDTQKWERKSRKPKMFQLSYEWTWRSHKPNMLLCFGSVFFFFFGWPRCNSTAYRANNPPLNMKLKRHQYIHTISENNGVRDSLLRLRFLAFASFFHVRWPAPMGRSGVCRMAMLISFTLPLLVSSVESTCLVCVHHSIIAAIKTSKDALIRQHPSAAFDLLITSFGSFSIWAHPTRPNNHKKECHIIRNRKIARKASTVLNCS